MRCKRRCNVGEFALLQLRLPEYRVHIVEAVVDPSLFLYVVKVDETTRVGITVHGSKNTPPSELKSLLLSQIVPIVCVEHTVGESLTGSNTE